MSESSHMAAKAAFKYAGAYSSMNFMVSDATWKWEDDNKSFSLGGGECHVELDHRRSNCFAFLFYQGSTSGPRTGFNPNYDKMKWNKDAGVLTIQGKTRPGRPFTCWVTVIPGH